MSIIRSMSRLGLAIRPGTRLVRPRLERKFCSGIDRPQSNRQDGKDKISDEEFSDALQNSMLPMFIPTSPTEVAAKYEGKIPIFSFLEVLLNEATAKDTLIEYNYNADDFRKGAEQARSHVTNLFLKGDFENMAKVASEKVVQAFRDTNELFRAAKGFEYTYEIDSVSANLIYGSSAAIDDNQGNLVEIVVRFDAFETMAVRNKDTGELLHEAMTRAHFKSRTWKFESRVEDSGDCSPWIVSAIL